MRKPTVFRIADRRNRMFLREAYFGRQPGPNEPRSCPVCHAQHVNDGITCGRGFCMDWMFGVSPLQERQ